MLKVVFATALAFLRGASCINFPFEAVQLTEAKVGNFSAIAFASGLGWPPSYSNATNRHANSSSNGSDTPLCKAYPGTASWPPETEWAQLNDSMSGGLLRPSPPGTPCYAGPGKNLQECQYILTNGSSRRFYLDDPVTVLTSWPQGDTCPVSLRPVGNCTQGGFPLYVVNVSTVAQVQAAVNFARNRNVRLVVK